MPCHELFLSGLCWEPFNLPGQKRKKKKKRTKCTPTLSFQLKAFRVNWPHRPNYLNSGPLPSSHPCSLEFWPVAMFCGRVLWLSCVRSGAFARDGDCGDVCAGKQSLLAPWRRKFSFFPHLTLLPPPPPPSLASSSTLHLFYPKFILQLWVNLAGIPRRR
jgi:hypothetical protein